jgi:uroporphyrinogen III methyltransferase/synthase
MEVYDTVPETGDTHGGIRRLVEEGADWILFCSSSAAENFQALRLPALPGTCRWASLGPVTSATMRRLGMAVDVQAPESRLESLVQAVCAASAAGS